jgi:hypothetical protein
VSFEQTNAVLEEQQAPPKESTRSGTAHREQLPTLTSTTSWTREASSG